MGNKRGMTAVFLTMILAAVLGVAALLFEGACSAAAKSMCQGVSDLAGRSVLSQYHPDLKEDYGLFGLSADEDLLSQELNYYIEGSFGDYRKEKIWKRSGTEEKTLELVAISVEGTRADPSEYLLIKPEILEGQILDYMKYRGLLSGVNLAGREEAIRSGLSESRDAVSQADRRQREAEEAERRQEEADRKAEEAEDEDEDEKKDRRRRRREVKKLKNLLSAQKREQESWLEIEEPVQRTLRNQQSKAELPSQLIDYSAVPNLSGLLSGGVESALIEGRNSLFLNEYLLLHCSDYVNGAEKETFFRNEIEYILCGHPDDAANIRQVRLYLLGLRTSLNLAHIYRTPAKREATLELAVSIAPGPGAPAVQFLIASLWAGAEAQWDVKDLLRGEAVPFIKTEQDWKLDLGSLLQKGEDGSVQTGGIIMSDKGNQGSEDQKESKKGQVYEDYLRLFLMVQSREARLVRLMDVIQLNLQMNRDREFRMADYCGGFAVTAAFTRRTGLFSPFGDSGRYIYEKIQKY